MLQLDIIEAASAIDKHVAAIKQCLKESCIAYSAAEIHAVRNLTFNRLTAMLGDGYVARVGFTDWRKDGVAGYRPLVIKCLGLIYKIAQKRLRYAEMQDPDREVPPGAFEGSEVADLTFYQVSVDTIRKASKQRWSFIWDGEDIVHKIVHR